MRTKVDWGAARRAGAGLLFAAWSLLLGLPLAWAAPRANDDWRATVTYVVDGDTLRVRVQPGAKPVSLRILGIDAPEICQPGGDVSRDALRQLALRQVVTVHGRQRDHYGRLLARVDLGETDLGAWMVERGWAWSYRYRRDLGPYIALERQARAARRGLFRADADAAREPRDFRQSHGTCYPAWLQEKGRGTPRPLP